MGRITVLTGSMRKDGNTDRLAGAFAEGARKSGNTVEIFSVADYKVEPCVGCNACFSADGKCFQNDDMAVIYDALKKADMLVVASPVYFYGISARLKAVIDRLHTPMRKEFPIKKSALLLVGAATSPGLFDAVIAQYRMILSYFGIEDAGMVLARGAKDPGDIKEDALKEAFDLGASVKFTD